MFTLKNIRHQYNTQTVVSLTDWQSTQGQQWLLRGQSGSGKTTLLHIMAGLLRPTSGTISIAGTELNTLRGAALDRFRGNHIGIVFQQAYLVKTLSVIDNLLLARYMANKPQDKNRCLALLERLRVAHTARQLPHQLSQGEAQRISIARAIINEPDIIFADEPTSSLDDHNCAQVIELIREQAQSCNATLVVSTHDQRIAHHFEFIYKLGE